MLRQGGAYAGDQWCRRGGGGGWSPSCYGLFTNLNRKCSLIHAAVFQVAGGTTGAETPPPPSLLKPRASCLLIPPPPAPVVYATPMYTIITVPTPTVAWTRAWLARNTYNCRHTHAHATCAEIGNSGPIERIRLEKKSWRTSREPDVLKLANVTTKPFLIWPHYILYVIKLRTQLLRSLRLL